MISPDEAGALRQTLRELLAYKDMDLVRKEQLGTEHCLEGINERAKPVLALFSRIDESKLGTLTGASHETLGRSIDAFRNFFEDALGYDPKDMSRGSSEHNLHGRLDQLVLEHYAKTQVIIDYLYPLEDQANNILESIKAIEEKCKRVLRALQNTAAKEGVGENATNFLTLRNPIERRHHDGFGRS